MLRVRFDDISDAFDFVSCAAPGEHCAYVSLDTGTVYWVSDVNPLDLDLPDDIETSDRYVPVPHKYDLDLGNALALRFAGAELPDRYREVDGFFRRRGAYARFKDLLASEGRLEQWFAFEADATELALKRWCEANGIEVLEVNGPAS